MIVVGVRVTRISTDGCAVRVQFVVGLHSVPYLFNSNFYQLTLRASNDRVLFFFALISAPARALYEPGEGVYKEAQTPALCDYTVQLRGGVAWRGYTVRSCYVAVLWGCGIGVRYRVESVIHRGYPQCGELTRM